MKVLYTHYLTMADIGGNWIYYILGLVVLFLGLFWIIVFAESGSKANFICMICLLVCGLFLTGLSLALINIESNYVDYKEVIFNDGKIDVNLLKDYTITDVKGDIYTIKPVKPLKEEKQNEH